MTSLFNCVIIPAREERNDLYCITFNPYFRPSF